MRVDTVGFSLRVRHLFKIFRGITCGNGAVHKSGLWAVIASGISFWGIALRVIHVVSALEVFCCNLGLVIVGSDLV